MNPINPGVPQQGYPPYQDPNYVVQNVVQGQNQSQFPPQITLERVVQSLQQPQYQPQNIQTGQVQQQQPQTSQFQQQYQPQYQNPYVQQQQGGQVDSFAKNLSKLLQNMDGRQEQKGQNPLSIFEVPPKATSSLYVDGIPIDSNEREVCRTFSTFFPQFQSHQDIFRPYPGFKAVRLIRKEAKNGRQFYFCFVDFDSKISSTIAMETLQGYRFDKSDRKGLKILYADRPSDKRRGGNYQRKQRDNRDNRDNRDSRDRRYQRRR